MRNRLFNYLDYFRTNFKQIPLNRGILNEVTYEYD
ncbi:hypothetical protein DET49_1053 [Salegentibacter sp. 24]|nr:hypothetical protein DET49_1053 [Salegentibacter sp. 24]